jgi:hypothetical protein
MRPSATAPDAIAERMVRAAIRLIQASYGV